MRIDSKKSMLIRIHLQAYLDFLFHCFELFMVVFRRLVISKRVSKFLHLLPLCHYADSEKTGAFDA